MKQQQQEMSENPPVPSNFWKNALTTVRPVLIFIGDGIHVFASLFVFVFAYFFFCLFFGWFGFDMQVVITIRMAKMEWKQIECGNTMFKWLFYWIIVSGM